MPIFMAAGGKSVMRQSICAATCSEVRESIRSMPVVDWAVIAVTTEQP